MTLRTNISATDLQIGDHASQHNEANSYINVVKEAPLNVEYPEFGASALKTSAQNQTAIQGAIDALPAAGGTLLLPNAYSCDPLDVSDTRAITLQGVGGMSAGAACRSRLVYPGTAGRFLDARSSLGFWLKNVEVRYTHASFAGSLIDFSHSAAATDAAYGGVERCFMSGQGVRGAACIVNLDKAIIIAFRDSFIGGGLDGARGQASAGSYSNVIKFDNCTFLGNVNQHCRNAGESWTFSGCTFESLVTSGGAAAGAGAHTFDAGVVSEGLTYIDGCWFGDATSAGDWINFNGQGLTVIGCHIGGGSVGVRTDQNNTIGVTILGNDFDGMATAGIVVSGTGHRGYLIESNVMIGGSAPMLSMGGTFPAGSRIQDPSNAGGAFAYTSQAPIITSTVSDASFTFTPCDGMMAVENTGGVRKVCYRIGGTWYKATLT